MKRRVFALLMAMLPFVKPKPAQAAPSNALVTQASLQVMWSGTSNALVTQVSLQVMHDGGLTPSDGGETEVPQPIWFMS